MRKQWLELVSPTEKAEHAWGGKEEQGDCGLCIRSLLSRFESVICKMRPLHIVSSLDYKKACLSHIYFKIFVCHI